MKERLGLLEALLFAGGEAVESRKLTNVMGISQNLLSKLVEELNRRYEENDSALKVLKLENAYQLTTRTKYAEAIGRLLESKRNSGLSGSALEVLSIVAYNQPVTRSMIDRIRGIDSSKVISNLIEKELIEEVGRLDIAGRPMAYGTTENFLRCFGLSSIDELPEKPD